MELLKCPDCEQKMEQGSTECPECGLESQFFIPLYSNIYSNSKNSNQGTDSIFKDRNLERAYIWGTAIAGGEYSEENDEDSVITLQKDFIFNCSYQGGTVPYLFANQKGQIHISATHLKFIPKKGSSISIPHRKMRSLKVGGAGAFQVGGNWVGGGFGLRNALTGAGEAAILNALTRRTKYDCVLNLIYSDADLTFQITDRTPRKLEADLSGVVKYLRDREVKNEESANPIDRIKVLESLSNLLEKGLISRVEFEKEKQRILNL